MYNYALLIASRYNATTQIKHLLSLGIVCSWTKTTELLYRSNNLINRITEVTNNRCSIGYK
jgi:hypothetical protein